MLSIRVPKGRKEHSITWKIDDIRSIVIADERFHTASYAYDDAPAGIVFSYQKTFVNIFLKQVDCNYELLCNNLYSVHER